MMTSIYRRLSGRIEIKLNYFTMSYKNDSLTIKLSKKEKNTTMIIQQKDSVHDCLKKSTNTKKTF